MKNIVVAALVYLSFLLGTAHITKAELLIDSGTPTPGGGLSILGTQTLAQQFSLAAGATITEIAPALARTGSGPDPVVKIQVSKTIGLGTPESSLIAEYSLTVSNYLAAFLPISTNFFLEPGTYYLVVSSTTDDNNSAFWTTSAPLELGMRFAANGANVDAAFPPASRLLPFIPRTIGDKFGFRISGDPFPLPPPVAHTPLLYASSTGQILRPTSPHIAYFAITKSGISTTPSFPIAAAV